MSPLIHGFTKNLSGCGGCGQVPQSVYEAIKKGKPVTFVLQVQVEAESAAEAIQKQSSGTVLSVNPRPQSVTSGGGTQYQKTTTATVP